MGPEVSQILTHTPVPLQHPPSLAGAFETAECVQTVSVLAHYLHGTLIDVWEERRGGGTTLCQTSIFRF